MDLGIYIGFPGCSVGRMGWGAAGMFRVCGQCRAGLWATRLGCALAGLLVSCLKALVVIFVGGAVLWDLKVGASRARLCFVVSAGLIVVFTILFFELLLCFCTCLFLA